MKSIKQFLHDKTAQLFALELKELLIGFVVGAVVTIILLVIFTRNGTIPQSLIEKLFMAAPAAAAP